MILNNEMTVSTRCFSCQYRNGCFIGPLPNDNNTEKLFLRFNILVHFVPDVSLPMDEAVGNIVQGSFNGTMATGATLVAARVGKGLYTDGQTGLINYGNHNTECCHNPDMCVQWVTFAMWIKRDIGAKEGIIFDSGGTSYDSKGKIKTNHSDKNMFQNAMMIMYFILR